jgi:hypothetical protein
MWEKRKIAGKAREKKLIRILPGLLGDFPLPWRHWIRFGPQALTLGPCEFFEIPETLVTGA